ncbi:oligosaccharide flippase family protein [Pseudomonas sp. YL-218 TE3947]|uniref:oligosaccharide flippase family protein n=1 Tax=Pseudomonas TaxID=286 RepID=UPI003D2300D6
MGFTVFVRLLTNVALFVFMARYWNVSEFGEFIYIYTAATIACLVVDFGFTQSILRDIGVNKNQERQILADVIKAKLVLSFILLLVSALTVIYLKLHMYQVVLFFIVLVSCVMTSFSESMNAVYRGINKYHYETAITLISNCVYFSVLMIILIMGGGTKSVALGMLFCKAVQLALSCTIYKFIDCQQKIRGSLKNTISDIRKNTAFGIDAFLTNLVTSIDTLIVGYLLGHNAVGIYQAGMRLLQGANTGAQVLSNVYLPSLSRHNADDDKLKALIVRLYFKMQLLGGLGAVLFIYGSAPMTSMIYGEKYVELVSLLPLIGVLLMQRYLAAAHGIVLSSLGHQSHRAFYNVLSMLIFLALSVLVAPYLGIKGIVISLLVSILVLHMLYIFRLISSNVPLGLSKQNIALTIGFYMLVAVFFINNFGRIAQ